MPFDKNKPLIAAAIGIMTSGAVADITGVALRGYQVSAEDFDGSIVNAWVVDMYLKAETENDTVLNAYDLRGSNGPSAEGSLVNSLGSNVAYYQSQTGSGWMPNEQGDPFTTDALRADKGARRCSITASFDGWCAETLLSPPSKIQQTSKCPEQTSRNT